MADSTPKSYHTDPALYLYTSLTAGSSHIITATSRLETILKANKISFLAVDVATDEKARMLWGRRAGKRKLPGLVRMGMIVGDLEEVEEWNEYGELKEHVSPGAVAPGMATPSSAPSTPSKAPPLVETPTKVRFTVETPTKASQSAAPNSPLTIAMRQAGLEAAKKAGDVKSQARAKGLGLSEASNDAVRKLNDSTAPGVPPPSGTTEAASARAPETSFTTAKSTADNAETTTSLTGPTRKGDSNPDSPAIKVSQALSEGNESLKHDKFIDAQLHTGDGGLEGENSDTKIATSREATNSGKPDVEDQGLVKAARDGKTTDESIPGS